MGVTKLPAPTLVTKLPPLADPGDEITWRHTKTSSDLFLALVAFSNTFQSTKMHK